MNTINEVPMNDSFETACNRDLLNLHIPCVTGYKLNAKKRELMVGIDLSGVEEGTTLDWFLAGIRESLEPVMREYVSDPITMRLVKDDWGHFEKGGSILFFQW